MPLYCYSWDHMLVMFLPHANLLIFFRTSYYLDSTLLARWKTMLSAQRNVKGCVDPSPGEMIGARHARVVAYVFDDIVVLSTMMLAIDSYLVVLLSSLVHNTRDIVCCHFTLIAKKQFIY